MHIGIDIEVIVLELGNISADNELNKSIVKHLPTIVKNIKLLNDEIEVVERQEIKDYFMQVAYYYYVMRDIALLT